MRDSLTTNCVKTPHPQKNFPQKLLKFSATKKGCVEFGANKITHWKSMGLSGPGWCLNQGSGEK